MGLGATGHEMPVTREEILTMAIPPPGAEQSRGVIVLGPYRSGTSLTARILATLGVNFGPRRNTLFRANRFNPGGYFERQDVTEANTRFIVSAGKTLADPGDPGDLLENANPQSLRELKLPWIPRAKRWGLKDPRMCGTLLAWIHHGLIPKEGLCIVRVTREIDGAVQSSMKHPSVSSYCDGTDAGVRAMLVRYDELAQWHVDHLKVPTHTIHFNKLLDDPQAAVKDLATFLGFTNAWKLRAASRVVGKQRALRWYYLYRYFFLLPRKVLWITTGGAYRRTGSVIGRPR